MFPRSVAVLLFVAVGAFAATEKVSVAVYYETLCPDSKAFINNQLFPVWEKVADSMNLTLIPFGKSTILNSTAFSCHHGEEECVGNKIQSCIMGTTIVQKVSQFKLINCLMMEASKGTPYPTKTCVEKIGGLDVAAVTEGLEKCANSTEGEDLFRKNGEITNALQSPLTSVPTVTLNGAIDKNAVSDFKTALCGKLPSNMTELCPKRNGASSVVALGFMTVLASSLLVAL